VLCFDSYANYGPDGSGTIVWVHIFQKVFWCLVARPEGDVAGGGFGTGGVLWIL